MNKVLEGLVGLVGGVAAAVMPITIDTTIVPAYAQSTSPKTTTLDRKVEYVPYTEYRKVIEESEYVVVMYYSSSKDTKDEFRQRHTQNEHGLLFMEWLREKYGENIQRFVVVDLPLGGIARDILLKEVEQNRYPSFAFYEKGVRKAKIRGPPTDKDIENNYIRFKEFLENANIVPIALSR